jgi:hypothetical protein
MMLNDPNNSIIDLLEISTESKFIKATNYILAKCVQTNSNIYSFDETYFNEMQKNTNRR